MFSTGRNMLLVTAVLGLMFVSLAYGNQVNLNWHKHNNTTCDDSTINGWHTTSTQRLCKDDDGADPNDVSCNTKLAKSDATNTTWTYTDGDEVILSTTERDKAFAGMTRTCAVVTRIAVAGSGFGEWAWHSGGKILMAATASGIGNVPGVVLAHEVGHKAGIVGDFGNPGNPPVTDSLRIMNGSISGSEKHVITSEKTSFESL